MVLHGASVGRRLTRAGVPCAAHEDVEQRAAPTYSEERRSRCPHGVALRHASLLARRLGTQAKNAVRMGSA